MMKELHRTWRSVARVVPVVLGAAVLAVFTPAARAQDQPSSAIRYYLGYMVPTDKYETTLAGGAQDKVTFQQAFGVGLGYEYRFNPAVGLDVSAFLFNPKVRQAVDFLGTFEKRLRVVPITIGPMFHFGSDAVQVYAGPEVAYVTYGKISAPENTKFKDEFTWGAKVGVDVPWSASWAFNATVQYIDARAKIDVSGTKLNPKPVIVTVGAAYRF